MPSHLLKLLLSCSELHSWLHVSDMTARLGWPLTAWERAKALVCEFSTNAAMWRANQSMRLRYRM
jgi:hypothetical protein